VLATVLSTFSFTATMPASAQSITPTQTIGMSNYHSYAIYDSPMSWEEAKEFCRSQGGYLVTITDEFEMEIVMDLVAEYGLLDSYYIGAYQEDGVWSWVTGEEMEYAAWGYGEPSYYQNEYYAEMLKNPIFENLGAGDWNDTTVDKTDYRGFICEWVSVPLDFPQFDITINGVKQDNAHREYPFIVYEDITYFPMTYNDCMSLGVTNNWSDAEKCSYITSGGEGQQYYAPKTEYSTEFNFELAKTVVNRVNVNGSEIFGNLEEYPFILYKDMIYFPLTWRWTSEFGWENTFDAENGLSIIVKEKTPKNKWSDWLK